MRKHFRGITHIPIGINEYRFANTNAGYFIIQTFANQTPDIMEEGFWFTLKAGVLK